MSEFCHISTTTGSRHDAERIATELVDRRLAACVHVSGPIYSTYRWRAQIEHSEEWHCVAKSPAEKFAEVAAVIRQLHPYDVPEIVATPIVDVSAAYLEWMRGETS